MEKLITFHSAFLVYYVAKQNVVALLFFFNAFKTFFKAITSLSPILVILSNM